MFQTGQKTLNSKKDVLKLIYDHRIGQVRQDVQIQILDSRKNSLIFTIFIHPYSVYHSSLSPMIPLLQSIFQICKLLQESCIWPDVSVLSDQLQCLKEWNRLLQNICSNRSSRCQNVCLSVSLTLSQLAYGFLLALFQNSLYFV